MEKGRGDEEQAEVGGLLAIQGHGVVQAWSAARTHVLQLLSLLMFVAPVITEGQEDRAADICSGPSQTAILGKTGPALTRCSTQENGPSTSPEQSRAEQDGPEGVRGEIWSPPPSAMW